MRRGSPMAARILTGEDAQDIKVLQTCTLEEACRIEGGASHCRDPLGG